MVKHTRIKSDLVVIIPVGPHTSTEFLSDTIESIQYYCSKESAIILVNDSRKELDSDLDKYHCDEVKMTKRMGKEAGLYFSLCEGMKYAAEKYSFKVILRMDDDAIITGGKPELDAIAFFKKHQDIGMIGSYRFNWLNEPRSFEDPKNQILRETSTLHGIKKTLQRKKHLLIKHQLQKALANGYELGEHVLGGAYFISEKCVKKMIDAKVLPTLDFEGSKLQEDHIFSMLTYVVNMKLGDFVTNELPMCLKLKGMPTTPAEVMKHAKKVVHSTRYLNEMKETEIRKLFKAYRT